MPDNLLDQCDELLRDIKYRTQVAEWSPLEEDKVALLDLIVKILKVQPAVDLEVEASHATID